MHALNICVSYPGQLSHTADIMGKYYTVISIYFFIVYNYTVHCIVLCGWEHQLSGKYRILSKNFDPFNWSISYTNSSLRSQTDHSLSKIHSLDLKKWRQIVEKRLPWQRRWQFWKIKFKVIAAVLLSWRGINTLILLNFSSAHATEFHLLLFFKLRNLQPSKKLFHTHKGNPSFCHIGGRIISENRFHAKNIISCDIPK